MNGIETLKWIKHHHPNLKVLMVTMLGTKEAVLECLRIGANGFITKDTNQEQFSQALDEISKGHLHYDQNTLSKITEIVQGAVLEKGDDIRSLTTREIEFIKLCCTEATYADIAQQMNLSPKTIDGYRESLFTRFGFKTRVSLVMFAITHGIVKLQSDE